MATAPEIPLAGPDDGEIEVTATAPESKQGENSDVPRRPLGSLLASVAVAVKIV